MKRLSLIILTIMLIAAILCVAVACDDDSGTQNANNGTNQNVNDNNGADGNGSEDGGGEVVTPPEDGGNEDGEGEENDDEDAGDVTPTSDGVFNYALNADGESYTVSGAVDKSADTYAIPALFNSKPVTAIDKEAFRRSDYLVAVSIPATVTDIGERAFSLCRDLENVTFGEGSELNAVGARAFFECESLDNLDLPDGVKSVGAGAFEECYSLMDLTVPASVERIGKDAFECAYTDSVATSGIVYFGKVAYKYVNIYDEGQSAPSVEAVIKDGTIAIADSAFEGMTELISVTVPASVTHIGTDAFTSTGLTSIKVDEENIVYYSESNAILTFNTATLVKGTASTVIPDGIETIGANAFKDVAGLVNITLPTSVTAIGACAFENCASLETVTLNSSVTVIPDGAFRGCTALKEIVIEKTVKEIAGTAFSGCTALKTVWIDSPDVIIACNMSLDAGHLLEAAETVYVSDRAFVIEGEDGEESEDPRKQESAYLVAFFAKGASSDGYTVWTRKDA